MNPVRKVLMLAYYYPPSNSSGVFRTLHLANHLASRGTWRPHIITLARNARDSDGYDKHLTDTISPLVRVHHTRCIHLRDSLLALRGTQINSWEPSTSQASNSRAGGIVPRAARLWQGLKDMVTEEILSFPDRQAGWVPYALAGASRVMREHSIHVIYSSGSPWSSHLVGYLLKKRFGVPLVVDYRDPWLNNPYEAHRSGPYRYLSKRLEAKIIEKSDLVICNTQALRRRYINAFSCEEKCITIPNGFERIDSSHTPDRKSPSPWLIVHAGAIYGARNPDNFFRAVARFKQLHPEIPLKVELIGADGTIRDRIEQAVGRDLARVLFEVVGRIPHGECLARMQSAGILLLFQQGTDLQVPRKLYDYMAVGKPVLAVCGNGDTADLVRDNRLGAVAPDDEAQILNALEMLNSQGETFAPSQASIRKFDNRFLVKELEAHLDRLVRKG